MTSPLWSSDQINFAGISATLYPGRVFEDLHVTRGDDGWVAGVCWDASGVSSGPQNGNVGGDVDDIADTMVHAGLAEVLSGESYAAPELGFGYTHIANIGVVGTPQGLTHDSEARGHKRSESVEMNSQPRRMSQSGYMSTSPGMSDVPDSPYSSSDSDQSTSSYPDPGPQALSSLSLSNDFVARPLIPNAAAYADFFADPNETLCLFNDIAAQFYPSPPSPQSSSSPPPTTSKQTPHPIVANYSGPIKNCIINMYTDADGVVWIVFPYSKNKEVKNHTIRCDVEKVPPSALREDIKTVSAAVPAPT